MRSWTHRPLRNVNASTRGFDICPGAGNAKNGERVLKTLRAETRSAFRIGVNMSARGFRIYSLSFLVSRQREGRRVDST